MSLYTDLVNAGAEIANHYSDLYVKKTDEVLKIIRNQERKVQYSFFVNQRDGEVWIDLPFQFDPYWENHCM